MLSEIYLQENILREHLKSTHEGAKFPCLHENCGLEHSSYMALLEHRKAEHNDQLLSCKTFGKAYKWRSSLYYHEKSELTK